MKSKNNDNHLKELKKLRARRSKLLSSLNKKPPPPNWELLKEDLTELNRCIAWLAEHTIEFSEIQ